MGPPVVALKLEMPENPGGNGDLAQMLAFVTGANGLLGSAVVRALNKRGVRVRGLVRPGSDRSTLEGTLCEIIEGDLNAIEALRKGAEGADWLFHCAGTTASWYGDPKVHHITNVVGTSNVFHAARLHRVKRAVYVGTIAVPSGLKCPFARTKLRATEIAFEQIKHGMHVVAVHPTVLVGPRDAKPSPMGQAIIDYVKGSLKGYPSGGTGVIDVEDCAEYMALAIERGLPGHEYILSAEYLSTDDIFRMIDFLLKRPYQGKKLPFYVTTPAAALGELGAKLSGKAPRLSWFAESYLKHKPGNSPSGEEERRVLRLPEPNPAEVAFLKAINWFQEKGQLQKHIATY